MEVLVEEFSLKTTESLKCLKPKSDQSFMFLKDPLAAVGRMGWKELGPSWGVQGEFVCRNPGEESI